MLSSRWLERPVWERMLRSVGAEPLDGKGPMNSAEWWRRPGHLPFTVPVEADGRCLFWAFRKVFEEQGGRPLHSPGDG